MWRFTRAAISLISELNLDDENVHYFNFLITLIFFIHAYRSVFYNMYLSNIEYYYNKKKSIFNIFLINY